MTPTDVDQRIPTTRGRWRPSPGLLVAGMVGLGLVAGALSFLLLERSGYIDPVKKVTGIGVIAGGPLSRDVAYASIVPGDEPVFTDGQVRLMLQGDEPATVTKVTSNGGDDVFELIGAKVAGPDRRRGAVQYRPTWPPAPSAFGPSTVDATGAVIEPISQTRGKLGYELLLGYRLKETEAFGDPRRSVTIEYTVAGTAFSYTEDAVLVMCPGDGRDLQCRNELDRRSREKERSLS